MLYIKLYIFIYERLFCNYLCCLHFLHQFDFDFACSCGFVCMVLAFFASCLLVCCTLLDVCFFLRLLAAFSTFVNRSLHGLTLNMTIILFRPTNFEIHFVRCLVLRFDSVIEH